MWKKEGLTEPEAVRNANEEFRYDMDSVGSFVHEVLSIDKTLQWRLPNKKLYDAYLKWCGRNNERCISQKSLSLRLQEKGFTRGISNGNRYWKGVGIKVEWV